VGAEAEAARLMLVATDSGIATGKREVFDSGIVRSRSGLEEFLYRRRALSRSLDVCGFLHSSPYSTSASVQ
jgi:hypothetical protein